MTRDISRQKQYIAERGLLPFWQRPENSRCPCCVERLRREAFQERQQATLRAFPQLIKESA